mmetsp:Transcript_28603/g.94934  ORF Transcript_28603/g.94934 Transcript_28603/m.94934 type:complete len:238 (+) Transcript_28603:827-1540(+)
MLDQTKFMPTRTKSKIEQGSPRASKTLSTDVGTCTPERLTARAKTSASNGALVMVRLNILPQLKPPAPTAKSAEPPESLLPLPTLPTVSTSMSSFFVGPASSNAFPSIVATAGASAAAELAGASSMWMGTRKEAFWTEREVLAHPRPPVHRSSPVLSPPLLHQTRSSQVHLLPPSSQVPPRRGPRWAPHAQRRQHRTPSQGLRISLRCQPRNPMAHKSSQRRGCVRRQPARCLPSPR